MIKENKGKLILTSIITMLPILIGLILWNQLPDKMPTHWNAEGVVDGWSSKGFTVFGLPLFLLGCHWLCTLATAADPKKQNHSGKILGIVFWICPLVSVFMLILVYGTALGMEFKVDTLMLIVMGLMFIIIGNYLPKCKQNYTIGIKVPWTLNDEENWNYTHRLSGKLWVICGIVVMLCVLLPANVMSVVLVAALIVTAIVPTIFSYVFYKKKMKSGD
ncbi:MAG: SdpI family protein [Tyzzerella sp.]|nr:SdpI family protein [Tyzzerella sp.]